MVVSVHTLCADVYRRSSEIGVHLRKDPSPLADVKLETDLISEQLLQWELLESTTKQIQQVAMEVEHQVVKDQLFFSWAHFLFQKNKCLCSWYHFIIPFMGRRLPKASSLSPDGFFQVTLAIALSKYFGRHIYNLETVDSRNFKDSRFSSTYYYSLSVQYFLTLKL